MVKEINDHYTKVQSQELTKAKEEVERLKGYAQHKEDCGHWTGWPKGCTCGLDELLKEVK